MYIYVYNHHFRQTYIYTPLYICILKPNRLQGKQVDVRQACEKYIFSCCWCICKKEMSSMRSGTKRTVIAPLALLAHFTIIVVAHYSQNVSSIVPPYMYHLCQCTPSIVDFSRVLDLVGTDILYENSKGTEFHKPTQLVMSIKIYVNDTCNKILVGQNLSDKLPIQKNYKQHVVQLRLTICQLRRSKHDARDIME